MKYTDKKIDHFRREYLAGELMEKDMLADPYYQLMEWLEDALRSGVNDPTAMALATSDPSGRPSLRMVLLKDVRPEGLVFFTAYNSRKGRELDANPHASVMFYWSGLDRQLRVEGNVKKVSTMESDDFFASRPLKSRISSIVSDQSEVIPDRDYLTQKADAIFSESNEHSLKRPVNWGGYILVPRVYEFWQGRENRLNDRIRYDLIKNGWEMSRLAP